MPTPKTRYAVFSKYCGHVVAVKRDREDADRIVEKTRAAGAHQFRVRTAIASDLLAVQQPKNCEQCGTAVATAEEPAEVSV